MAAAAIAADATDQATLQLLADNAGITALSITLGNETSIATPTDGTVTGIATVCHILATSTPQGQALVGTSPAHQAELNDRLATRTYVAGDQLTLADLVLYVAVDPAVPPPFVAPPPPKQAPAAVTKAADAKAASTKTDAPPTADAPPKATKKAPKEAAPNAPKPAKAAAGAPATNAASDIAVDMLDIRVGTIVEVGKHPNADALYLERIDLGEAEPRQVVSGLVRFVPLEAMQGRRVLVVCNLKPAKMRDVMSYGMVLCASNEAHDAVDPVLIPQGVSNGERVAFEGFAREPEAQINPKKKIFEQIAPDLRTNAEGVVVYKGVPCMTSKGPVTASIPNGSVA